MPPSIIPGMRPSSTCRSEPQMAVVVTFSSTSVGAWIVGLATSRISSLPTSTKETAFIHRSYAAARAGETLLSAKDANHRTDGGYRKRQEHGERHAARPRRHHRGCRRGRAGGGGAGPARPRRHPRRV